MTDTTTARERLRALGNGFQISQAIHVAATLGIADLLAGGPRDVPDLATSTGSDPEALYRLLRALASVGVFHEDESRRFSLSELADGLRSDAPGSVAGWAAYVGRPLHWGAWGQLLHSIRTGQNAFESIHDGESVWSWRERHPDDSAIFDQAMTSNSKGLLEALTAAFDFGPYERIVDVGGGRGALLAGILARYPNMRGVLFDAPHVVSGAPDLLDPAGVMDRCEIVSGDFFVAVPGGADAYLMKSILHDWEDDEAVRILTTVRGAGGDRGELLLVESIVAVPNEGSRAKFSDLNMLVAPGGRERTLPEWTELLAAGGFRLERTQPFGQDWHVIVGKAVPPAAAG